jgi:hypothetical protein
VVALQSRCLWIIRELSEASRVSERGVLGWLCAQVVEDVWLYMLWLFADVTGWQGSSCMPCMTAFKVVLTNFVSVVLLCQSTCLPGSLFLPFLTAACHPTPGVANATAAGSRQLTSTDALHEVGEADSASMVKEKIAGVLTQEVLQRACMHGGTRRGVEGMSVQCKVCYGQIMVFGVGHAETASTARTPINTAPNGKDSATVCTMVSAFSSTLFVPCMLACVCCRPVRRQGWWLCSQDVCGSSRS